MANHPNRRKGYSRSVTVWHATVDSLGRHIKYITSDEIGIPSPAVCSIYDYGSDEPSYRLLWETGERRSFGEADEPFPECGLIVLGYSKHGRPDLDETAALKGIKGHIAADAVRRAEIARLEAGSLAEAAEREECARVADDYAKESHGLTEEQSAAEAIAASIRQWSS